MNSPARIALFGSTGSIGLSAAEVIESSGGTLSTFALSAHRSFEALVELARRLSPRFVIATDADAAGSFDWTRLPPKTELLIGPEALCDVARDPDVDAVLAGITGAAGLESVIAAAEAGKRIALANKESLVVAGPLLMRAAATSGAEILPVDSEHSAIFQALQAGKATEVQRIILTASGGAFRDLPLDELAVVTPEMALNHPTWDMGPKITVDSATMMNKALEIIEARWLFPFDVDQIDVVIHPQSIVHSMVEYVDGSVMAQLSPPDMRLPIQYALTYPERRPGPAAKLVWAQEFRLDFQPPDANRYPALQLGREVARAGGTAGAVLNAVDEAAVQQFLEGRLPFVDIVPVCRRVVERHAFEAEPSLERLLELDRWAREEVVKWICS